MFRRGLAGLLLVGFSVWLIGHAYQVVSADDKPAKKTDAAKEQASTAKSAEAGQSPRRASAEARDSARRSRERAEPRRDREAARDWDEVDPPARPGDAPWWRDRQSWGENRGPWAHGPWGRGWGGPWAQGPRGPHWDDLPPYEHYGSGRGPWHRQGGPWAHGPRWGGPWAHGPRWGGPPSFGRPGWGAPWGASGFGQAAPRVKWPSADELFSKFDANKDGNINKEEFAAGMKKVQERLHGKAAGFGQGAGQVGGFPGFRSPFGPPRAGGAFGAQAGMSPGATRPFDQFDKNKDGKLTKDEVPERLWEHFSKADANKDAAVTKDELETARKKMAEQFRQKVQERAAESQGPQAGPAGRGRARAAGLFDQFDKNKDGKLSKDEAPERLWERVSGADTNKDGSVTKEEWEAAHKNRGEPRGAKPSAAKPTK